MGAQADFFVLDAQLRPVPRIVAQVIDFWVFQVSALNSSRRAAAPACCLASGLDQQRGDAPGRHRRLAQNLPGVRHPLKRHAVNARNPSI